MVFRQFGCVTLVCFLSFTGGVQAVLANAFEPPPEQGAPRSTAGGGSRPAASSCTLDESSGLRAMALAPQTFVGLSSQKQPELWLYLPTNEVERIEVSVFDEQLNGLTQVDIMPPEMPGVFSVDISKQIDLSSGGSHYWTAAFICSANRRTEDWVVGGWIKHQPVSANEQTSLQAMPWLDRVEQYLDTGYWYDALALLLLLEQTGEPRSMIETAWDALIQQASLNLTMADLQHVARSQN